MHIDAAAQERPLFTMQPSPVGATVTLQFEGQSLTVPPGLSVAAALLLHGAGMFRSTPVSGAPRAPYCMMGVCFECLVEIDGKPARQACLTTVRDGMIVRRQQGAPALPALAQEQEHGL